LRDCGFEDIVISLKTSDVRQTVAAYRLFAKKSNLPLHIGITEAGTLRAGLIASAAGLGLLLDAGIGDTLRVSLTAPVEEEIRAGVSLLRHFGLRQSGARVISCPTCGRTRVNLMAWAEQVETALADCPRPLTIAVMGCAVNGPGEAAHADAGLAAGDGKALLFAKGKIIATLPEDQAVTGLLAYINS